MAMLFNSLQFLVFFPVVTAIYFLSPHRFRWLILLIASYYFYMSWKVEYALLIGISTISVYCLALAIEKNPTKKKLFLFASLGINLSILFFFKYWNFALETIETIAKAVEQPISLPTAKWLLPVGISFYTFQALSYVIDVAKGRVKAEKHFGKFALYVSFFPQLVAGPIERASHLLPQFSKKISPNYEKILKGLKIMLWGFFLKVVIADRMGILVDKIYNDPTSYTGLPLLISTYLFAFQIYCDFAGYSFIAIGSAKVLGFDLMDNFRMPYLARSVREFWGRWHISLSTWFMDYIYIPLGGNRVSNTRWIFNIAIVFFLSGLWHGAAWTFVIWGLLHALMIVIEKFVFPKKDAPSIFRRFLTFNLVCFAWIFFRANSISDAIYIIKHLFVGWEFDIFLLNTQFSAIRLLIAGVLITILTLVHISKEFNILKIKSKFFAWGSQIALIISILVFGVFDKQEFLYFQF